QLLGKLQMRAKAVAVHLREAIGDAARREAAQPVREIRCEALGEVHQREATADERAVEVEKDRARNGLSCHPPVYLPGAPVRRYPACSSSIAYREISRAVRKAAPRATPPITAVCRQLRMGFAPAQRPLA